MANKADWRKRAKGYRQTIAGLCDQLNALSEREAAALNKAEEHRRDAVRLATELARVQGVCEATEKQVLKHADTIRDLREEENAERRGLEEVLTWQRGVREAWKATEEPRIDQITLAWIDGWNDLRELSRVLRRRRKRERLGVHQIPSGILRLAHCR